MFIISIIIIIFVVYHLMNDPQPVVIHDFTFVIVFGLAIVHRRIKGLT